jgi:hypothetical protein
MSNNTRINLDPWQQFCIREDNKLSISIPTKGDIEKSTLDITFTLTPPK